MFIAILLLTTINAAALASRPHVAIRSHQNSNAAGWKHNPTPSLESTLINFNIYLHQQGLEDLSTTFDQVSDPASKAYGKFLTKSELDSMVYASDSAIETTQAWLEPFDDTTVVVNSDSIHVQTTVASASKMFECNFHTYLLCFQTIL